MLLYYDTRNKFFPYIISDECGTFLECDKEDLIELEKLIEKVLTNPEDCDKI